MSFPESADNKTATAPGRSTCLIASIFATFTACQVGISICNCSVMQQYITTMRQMTQVHCSRQHGKEQQLLSVPNNPHAFQLLHCISWFLPAFKFLNHTLHINGSIHTIRNCTVLSYHIPESCTPPPPT